VYSAATTVYLMLPCTPLQRTDDQAFEIVARPALDSFESTIDRIKMNIYMKYAEWGWPCPITGRDGEIGAAAANQKAQQ